ncbi:Rad52/Rad22 family DNA repair protein [Streptosporangium amethystogenes subsp. fukuiense]|uniref:Rad52/Rad22 family DNA repair protein n=1 Tax=Streptosporangium amethystogenes subsp. fukuiense TaxID=698418 RepID=A0ABW2T5U6_9ACTN
MGFTRAQVDQLLRPINSKRVLQDGKGKSHVSQQDVAAHLIRIFGFGNWDTELLSLELIFETERTDPNTDKPLGKWDVCYKATMRLTVKDEDGREVCHYEDGATATAENQKRGAAHDLALKSAISLAKKRCAIELGDQFGLSLYNKGQQAALVRGTLVRPGADVIENDIQEGIDQQVDLGNDEGGDAGEEGDGLPRNKDGSISRSRVTDEQLAAVGAMTKGEKSAHNKLVKDTISNPKTADRGPVTEDLWVKGGSS